MDTVDGILISIKAGLVVLLGIAVLLQFREQRISATVWQEFADETGLLYMEGDNGKKELRGTYRGYEIRVWVRVELEPAGRYSMERFYTELTVSAQEEALGSVQVARRTRDEIPRRLRRGPLSFETAFDLGGDEFGRQVFGDERVQAAFLELRNSGANILYGGRRLMLDRNGQMTTREELKKYIDRAIDAVERLDDAARREIRVAQEVEQGIASKAVW